MKKHVALFSSVLMMSTTLLGAGGVFAEQATPDTESTPVSATLSIPDEPAPTPPTEGGDNNNGNNTTGHFGLAYQPTSFSTSDVLDGTGEKEVAINPSGVKGGFHLGVKDTRRQNSKWQVTAKLDWSGNNAGEMAGTTIKANNDNIKLNNNGELSNLSTGEVTGVSSLTIGNQATPVMMASGEKQVKGVYDYELKNVKLVIPNQEDVAADAYNGTVTWNLAETPQ
ncbi:hypothetical protein CUM50_09870 [Enterococcus faecium]|uniref:WxL domain-containing protein n=1 Tax=Enterococcus faecium TaxID=1352 RepID=UPI000CF2B51C|nr:WxL domain-containing protein [Enterococcus faecium]EGP5042746.1 hypothetical protein [Enterococcus faecium]EGP5512517.1 hypothetical protein [Enterococcus faecium]PQD72246.1 hypothetical protein CUM50_09870 [Enterococcus faecium]